MAPRHAATPDCALPGCTRAARRLGLCAAHAHAVPVELSAALVEACAQASYALRRHYEAIAAEIAAEALEQTEAT